MTSLNQSLDSNPLLKLESTEIAFDKIRPEHLAPAFKILIAKAEQEYRAIGELEGPRTFANTILAYDRAGSGLRTAWEVVSMLKWAQGTEQFVKAIKEIELGISEHQVRVFHSEKLWAAIQEFSTNSLGALDLSEWQQRFLKSTMDSFRQNGADLNPEGKTRLIEIEKELRRLGTNYRQNCTASVEQSEIWIVDESYLRGLPKSLLDQAKESASKKGRPEAWCFSATDSEFTTIMTFADDSALRREMHKQYWGKAQQAEFNNYPLAEQILALRAEKTALLGYATYVDWRLTDRMAGDYKTARAFIDEMRMRVRPYFEAEVNELEAHKQKLSGDPKAKLEAWDYAYYAESLRRERYSFDQEKVREYFSLDNALNAVFGCWNSLYGWEVKPNASLAGWHSDVKAFDLFDKDGTQIGSFYTDFSPRKEEGKSQGAWMWSLIQRVEGAPGHEKFLGMMAGNFSAASPEMPILLYHSQLVTFFHESGHLAHHAAIKTDLLRQGQVLWDIIELPSQLNESYAWDIQFLRTASRHYLSGEQMPLELAEQIERSRNFGKARFIMGQLAYADLDLQLHSTYDPQVHGDLGSFARNILQSYRTFQVQEYDTMIAHFTHIFDGAYDGNLYSYMWALAPVAAVDKEFEKRGRTDRATGEFYQSSFLAPGDSVAPLAAINRFLGNPPDTSLSLDALMQRYGFVGLG